MDHSLKTTREHKKLKKQEIQDIFILFQHDMASGDFKDLPRRTASGKVLHDKTFNVSKISKYNGYQIGLASIVYRFFEKKSIEGQKKVLQLLIPFKMF